MYCVDLLGVLPRIPFVITEISAAPEAPQHQKHRARSHNTESLNFRFSIHRHPREGGDPYLVKALSDARSISAVAG